MAWQQLTLRIAASALPRTEALLRLAGAESISISEGDDTEIFEPEPGATPLWDGLTVRALFDDDLDLTSIDSLLGSAGRSAPAIERITDEDLASAMAEIVEPIEIGPRLAIVPTELLLSDAAPRQLGLHMGLAFGTGRHPTTRLCLQWLERSAIDRASVLDYGCGTGVLALAAVRLGADHATAVDNEPQALDATRRNAELNRLDDRLTIGPPESLGAGPFELIIANILAQPLLDLAETFAAIQLPQGRIVLSGILESQLDRVEQHYRRWYRSFSRRALDGWALLTGTRRNEYDR